MKQPQHATPAALFRENAADLAALVTVSCAIRVKEGQDVVYGSEQETSILPALEDGWQTIAYKSGMPHYGFNSRQEFNAHSLPLREPAPVIEKMERLPEHSLLIPVARGETMQARLGLTFVSKAPYDGFIMKAPGGQREFVPNFFLDSVFHYAGQRERTQEELIVTPRARAAGGFILPADTGFARAGSVLVQGKNGPAVYTPRAARLALRLAPPGWNNGFNN